MSEARAKGIARNPWGVLAAAILVGVAIVSGVTALFAALIRSGALSALGPATQLLLFTLLLYGLLAVVAVVGTRLAGMLRSGVARATMATAGLGLAIGVGGFLLALGEASLAGATRLGPAAAGGIGGILAGTLAMLGQSAAEELYFRGWLQPVLVRAWGLWPGVAVAALAFAALHVAGGARSPLTLLNLALGGVLFGLLAARVGLAAAIAAHFGWNWAEGILFGLDPNPGVGGFGALRDLDLGGSARWGGSAEGLNASLAMLVVLLALLLPLAFWDRRAGDATARS